MAKNEVYGTSIEIISLGDLVLEVTGHANPIYPTVNLLCLDEEHDETYADLRLGRREAKALSNMLLDALKKIDAAKKLESEAA